MQKFIFKKEDLLGLLSCEADSDLEFLSVSVGYECSKENEENASFVAKVIAVLSNGLEDEGLKEGEYQIKGCPSPPGCGRSAVKLLNNSETKNF